MLSLSSRASPGLGLMGDFAKLTVGRQSSSASEACVCVDVLCVCLS